ncbi:hypothetical protein [Bacillus altitudinis]|nr:hypothetical protein [Bacillus altitudinis]
MSKIGSMLHYNKCILLDVEVFKMAHREQRKGAVLAVFDTLMFGVPVLL